MSLSNQRTLLTCVGYGIIFALSLIVIIQKFFSADPNVLFWFLIESVCFFITGFIIAETVIDWILGNQLRDTAFECFLSALFLTSLIAWIITQAQGGLGFDFLTSILVCFLFTFWGAATVLVITLPIWP